MSKKNNKKNDIAAVEEVAANINTETEILTETVPATEPAEVTDNTEPVSETETSEVTDNTEPVSETETSEVTDNTEEIVSEPESSASVEIVPTEGVPTEHKILVKSESGVFEVHVSAVTRQDAKYRVYLKLDQFGPNAKVPKFDVDKYLARKNSTSTSSKGRKKGEKKSRSVVVVDLDAPQQGDTDNTEVSDNTEVFNNPDVTVGESSENIM